MRSLVLVAPVLCAGCVATYTPPVRGLLPGMPDRLRAGEFELAGTVGGVVTPTTGGPHLAYAVSDTLTLEAGGNANFIEGLWATLWAGARLIRSTHLSPDWVLSGDFEFGFGGGVGGRSASLTPSWFNRPVVGVYDGVGVGLRWKWLGGFARGRVDGSAGLDPSTLWASALLGAEARLGDHVVFSLGGGGITWWNVRSGWVTFWLYQAQLSVHFDLAD